MKSFRLCYSSVFGSTLIPITTIKHRNVVCDGDVAKKKYRAKIRKIKFGR